MAFAARYRGEDKVCLAFCGDGSTSRADFHEALSIASVQSLPNVFVIENNQYAYSTPLRLTSHSQNFSDKAKAYGIPGVTVDGTDVLAVHDAVAEAVTRARAGDGPSIVEGVTMRMHGHAEHDPADYVVKELYDEYGKKDPVELFENVLLKGGVLDDDAVKKTREDARQAAIAARRKALADPMPDPSNVEEGVYAD
jgi:pyruvate dehydrogenase E1 component alpha subunit